MIMSAIICIAIVSEQGTLLDSKAHGKKRMGECGLVMAETEAYLYLCEKGHKRYFPFNKHDLRSKIHSHTKDQDAYY